MSLTVTALPPEIQSASLRKNFFWALAGNGFYAASQWLMLVTMARLGSPAMVGRYALALSIAAPVMLFCNLQLRAMQASDAAHQHSFPEYLSLRSITSALGLALVAAIAFNFGYSSQAGWVILTVGCAKAIESVSDILFGLMQKHERLDYIACSQMLKGPLSLLALACGVYFTRRLLPGVIAICAAWLIVLIAFDLRNVRRFTGRQQTGPHRGAVRWGRLVSLARSALPLGFVSMLVSLNWNVARYFLEHYQGETALGYFAAMVYLPSAGLLAIDALAQSAIARLARDYQVDRKAYDRLLLQLLGTAAAVGLTGLLIAFFAGEAVLRSLYGPAYACQPQVLLCLMATALEMYLCSILGVALTSARFLRGQLAISLTVVTASVVCSWALVPRFGQMGAAWSMFMASAIWLGLLLASVLYVTTRRPPPTAFGLAQVGVKA